MNIIELRKRTRVFEDVCLVTDSMQWSNAKVIAAYRHPNGEWSLEDRPGSELFGYIHPTNEWSEMGFDELPVEFFNHQLFDCDPHDEGSVRSFIATWGFPFLPFRNMYADTTSWHYLDRGRIARAIRRTSAVRDFALVLGNKYYDDEYRHDYADASAEELEEYGEEYWVYRPLPVYGESIPDEAEWEHYKGLYSTDNIGICDAISLDEAALTLAMLQEAVRSIMDSVRNGSAIHARHLDTVNMGSSYQRLLHWDGAYSGARTRWQHYSMLTSAICNQVIDAFADEAPWRDCACEGCSVTFKRKQSRAYAPTSDSIYCCVACEERQKKRNQRAAARNRIRR